MDPRIERFARVLTEFSLPLAPGDDRGITAHASLVAAIPLPLRNRLRAVPNPAAPVPP